MPLTDAEIVRLGNVLLGKVMELSIRMKLIVVARAGIDVAEVPAVQDNAVVNPAIAHAFGKLDLESKQRALPILADAIARISEGNRKDLIHLLGQHGYQYVDDTFIPVGLIDEREARYLPRTATSELTKAISRLADKDESGAITAACGAVDGTTTALYEKHGFGDPGGSFQAKINTVINRLGVFDKLERELIEIKIKPEDARKIREEMHEATKHAAEALQVIRRTNGDVHGTKATYTRIVYETIKWSSAICGLLEGE